MIKNEEYSLLNKKISNDDMIALCKIFEVRGLSFTCKVTLKNGTLYTYKYFRTSKEKNPFLDNFFKNMTISTIWFSSKICKMFYGENTSNSIIFEGDEKDETYQYFFTQINAWLEKLVKLKRIKMQTVSDYVLFAFIALIFATGLSVGYGFLSMFINKSILSAVFASIFLGLTLLLAIVLYMGAFVPYEINIGKCRYKKFQNSFYFIFSSCIIPIILGLIV